VYQALSERLFIVINITNIIVVIIVNARAKQITACLKLFDCSNLVNGT